MTGRTPDLVPDLAPQDFIPRYTLLDSVEVTIPTAPQPEKVTSARPPPAAVPLSSPTPTSPTGRAGQGSTAMSEMPSAPSVDRHRDRRG